MGRPPDTGHKGLRHAEAKAPLGKNIHTYIHTYRQTDRQTDRHTYRHTYRQTDRHDIQTYIQTYRQTNIHTYHAYHAYHTYRHTYIPYIHTYIHTIIPSTHPSIHTYIHTHIHAYIRTYVHTYIDTYHPSIHPYIHAIPYHTMPYQTKPYQHTYIHTSMRPWFRGAQVKAWFANEKHLTAPQILVGLSSYFPSSSNLRMFVPGSSHLLGSPSDPSRPEWKSARSLQKSRLGSFHLSHRPWMDDPPIGSAPLWSLAPLSLSEPRWRFLASKGLTGQIVVEGLGIDNGKTLLQTIIAMIQSEG